VHVQSDRESPSGGGPVNLSKNMTVRRTRREDWAAYRALRLEMLADTPIAYAELLDSAKAHPREYWMDRIARRVASTSSAEWVVEHDGRLVGTLGCVDDEEGRAQIVAVYLAPRYRGLGLLDRLLAAAMDWARDRGLETLTLVVAQENERAVAAYRRRGFVATGRVHPHPLYPEITEEEMTRPLGPP
jgi:ribosomal protein S18 acetylase RimI-like enzyme